MRSCPEYKAHIPLLRSAAFQLKVGVNVFTTVPGELELPGELIVGGDTGTVTTSWK